ncbi:hypothetical protein ACU4HD_42895 [Cupriavidus basilensis]
MPSTAQQADGFARSPVHVAGGFDKPFNQAPSLHISLLVILWVAYAIHARGGWRWLLHGWFSLIGVSVLTTYQHHAIDVPTGWLVGWFCVFLFPFAAGTVAWRAAARARTRQLAGRRAAGALAVGAAALSAVAGVSARGVAAGLAGPVPGMCRGDIPARRAWPVPGGTRRHDADGRALGCWRLIC